MEAGAPLGARPHDLGAPSESDALARVLAGLGVEPSAPTMAALLAWKKAG